jgi:ribosome biogenesis GTPase A
MVPSIIENDMAIKLSLVGCIRDKILGLDVMVELLLESLFRYNQMHFMEYYQLKYEPKNAGELINMVREKFLEFDHARTCQRILDDFREGKLGKITLDEVELND